MREAVGLFKNMQQLQATVKELERTDFPRDSLSVLGEHKSLEPLTIEMLEDDSNAPREVLVRSEEKSMGAGLLVSGAAYLGAMAAALAAGAVAVPAILTAAAIGGVGGGALGGVLAILLGDHFNHAIEDQIKQGGLLLWVRTTDREKEDLACRILTENGTEHVRIHEH